MTRGKQPPDITLSSLYIWHGISRCYIQTNQVIIKSNSDKSIPTVGDFAILNMEKIPENSADPDETARMSRLIWIYTVCKPWPLQRPLGLKGLRNDICHFLLATGLTVRHMNSYNANGRGYKTEHMLGINQSACLCRESEIWT